MRNSRRRLRAPIAMLGALLIACGASTLVWAPLAAQAPGAEQEIGSIHWGPTVVWLRATDAGDVKVFASSGYRSAFVQPVIVSADDVDRWAAVLEQLNDTRATTTAQAVDDRAPRASDTTSQRMTLAAGDLVLEARLGASVQPKVTVWVGMSRPDVVAAQIFPDVAKQGAALLRAAAQSARHLRDVAAAVTPPAPTLVAATIVASNTTPSTEPASATLPPAAPSKSETLVTPPVAASLAGRVSAPAAPVPSQAVAGPAVAGPAVAGPAVAGPLVTRSTTTQVSFETPAPHATAHDAHDAHDRGTVLSVVSTKATTPLLISAPSLAHMASTSTTPKLAATKDQNLGVDRAAAHASNDGGSGVDDETVQNLVKQWRPELMYCYTQFGLREHPALVGEVIVRAALSPNGAVGHSLIESHTWNGAGGTDVEGCIRTRVAAWHFPPAATGSVHEFTLEFKGAGKT
jgi:hypothetical protein